MCNGSPDPLIFKAVWDEYNENECREGYCCENESSEVRINIIRIPNQKRRIRRSAAQVSGSGDPLHKNVRATL